MTNQTKTFSIRTPAAFMAKLRWERARLREIYISDNPAFQYQTINCASDAWHMTEWVFHHLATEERQMVSTLGKFKEQIKAESRPLRICRELADASKHFILTHKPDPDISTGVLTSDETGLEIDLWYIDNGMRADDPRQIIDGAISFWEIFMEHRGIPHS